MRTLIKFDDGLSKVKWLLIWNQQNKVKKLFFQKNLGILFTLISTLFVVEKVQIQKHLGLKLDKKLSFKEHLKN